MVLFVATPGLSQSVCNHINEERSAFGITKLPNTVLFSNEFGEGKTGYIAKWKTRVEIYGNKDKPRVLVRIKDEPDKCGYMDQANLLIAPQAWTVVKLFPDQKMQLNSGHIENTWRIKALLRSNPAVSDIEDPQMAMLFKSPDGDPHEASQVFGLFNIFDVDRRGSSKWTDWWYFIGGKQVMNTSTLSGWIRGENLFLWRSSIAVYYGAPGAPFDVYPDQQTLSSSNRNFRIGYRSDAKLPKYHDIPKFPVLRQIFTGEKDLENGLPPAAYEIGFLGRACQGDQCLSSEQVSSRIGDLGRFIREANNLDVLFLIDNTESMDRYFLPIASAIGEWAEEVNRRRRRENAEGQIRFAAAIFGDYNDYTAPAIYDMDFEFLVDFSNSAVGHFAENLQRALTSPPEYKDALEDLPEAGYAALIRAVQEAEWASEAGYKLVVWIGDHGVRPPGVNTILITTQNGTTSRTFIEPVSASDVRRVLKERDVYLAAIRVAGRYNEDESDNFKNNVDAILEPEKSIESRQVFGVKAISTFSNAAEIEDDPQIAAQRVQDLLSALLFHSRNLPEWIQSQRGVNVNEQPEPAIELNPDIPYIRLASDFRDGALRRLGFDQTAIQNLFHLRQMMAPGYVAYLPDQKNISFFAAVQPENMNYFLLPMFKHTCDAMSSEDIGNKLYGILINLSFAMGGDAYNPTQETVAEYLERALFIPKRHFASWLDKSLNEISMLYEEATSSEKSRMRLSVCRAAHLLELMLRNQRVTLKATGDPDPGPDIAWEDEATGRVRVADGWRKEKFVWKWSTESGITYYFIPVNFFPK